MNVLSVTHETYKKDKLSSLQLKIGKKSDVSSQ